MQSPLLPRNTLWLLLPPIALCSLDFGLTLYGQSDNYWQSNFHAVIEGSPSFARYLSIHPLVFIAAVILWITLFSALILLLPERFALTLVVAIVIGHMAGAASWLRFRFNLYQACNVLFLMVAVLIVFAFKCGQNADGRAAFNWERTGFPGWIRWVLIAGLFAIPFWWFIIPR